MANSPLLTIHDRGRPTISPTNQETGQFDIASIDEDIVKAPVDLV